MKQDNHVLINICELSNTYFPILLDASTSVLNRLKLFRGNLIFIGPNQPITLYNGQIVACLILHTDRYYLVTLKTSQQTFVEIDFHWSKLTNHELDHTDQFGHASLIFPVSFSSI